MSLVSVIIPTFNNPRQLVRAIKSVFKQTYRDIEIIIIDDGSDADYVDTIKLLKKESPFLIHYFKKVNEGPGLARQFGLNKSTGEFIQYLDSDDELLPNKLENQVATLNSNLDIVMTYGLSMIDNNPNNLHRSKNNREKYDNLLRSVLEVRKWHTSSCLWKYPKNTYWENLFNGEDVLHDFNVALNYKKDILFTNEIVTNINLDNSNNRLSNASSIETNHNRFVNDCLKLNLGMYDRLSEKSLINEPEYAEPLAERMFHAAMRVYLSNHKNESLKLIEKATLITKSIIKKIELKILILIINSSLKNKRKVFQLFYRIRRKLHSSNLHQFRFI